jgi:hypothetical protein
MIFDFIANFTKDLKATIAKPSPRADGHWVVETEPKDANGNQLFTEANPGAVTVNGSLVDLRGLAANKPLATAVVAGTTYWSVDTDPHGDNIEVSDGTTWTVM